jgi:hypothetical protein
VIFVAVVCHPTMRKIVLTAAALALALPAIAQADGTTPATPTTTAQKLCRAERGTTTATKAAFAQKYGTNKNKKNAFGKCVSQKASAKQDDPAGEDQGDDAHGHGQGQGQGNGKPDAVTPS